MLGSHRRSYQLDQAIVDWSDSISTIGRGEHTLVGSLRDVFGHVQKKSSINRVDRVLIA